MQLTASLRERDREDFDRIERASINPNRRGFPDPLDARLECPLGRLRVGGVITEVEYQAGVKWRTVFSGYLNSIQSPDEVSDDESSAAMRDFERALKLLEGQGKRVFHALNAVCVYEEPEELGDFEFTSGAAKIGLGVLASKGF